MAAEPVKQSPYSPPDQEVLELCTTVDPSYIIHLVRQFLASDDTDKAAKRLRLHAQDATTLPLMDESKDREAKKIQQHKIEDSCSSQGSLGSIQSSTKFGHCQADACEKTEIQHVASHTEIQHVASQEVREGTEGVQSVLETDEGLDIGQSTSPMTIKEENIPQGSRAVPKTSEEQREEVGCMLWDLAATQEHAEFMVKNHILDVLLAILSAPHADRIREVCLGILGNLACHAEPVKAIVRTSGLPNKIIQSLFVDDSPILSEACRFLSASLHSDQADSWVKAMDSQEILERVMWIAANTMNSLLLEKSTELLLAMVDCEGSTASVLLSSLVRLGLPAVLTDLLASEVTGFNKGMCSHGNMALDTILQIAEALSLVDNAARLLAESSQFFLLACQVIQLSGEEEVGPAAITAMVLVANLLAEREELIDEVSEDFVLIQQLVELLPAATDDPGARNACWSILGRLTFKNASCGEGSPVSTEMALVLARGSKVLLEDLQEHQDGESTEEVESSKGFAAKLETVGRVLQLMEGWMKVNKANDKEIKAYGVLQQSSSALKSWLHSTAMAPAPEPEPEPDKALQQQAKSDALENGSTET